MVLGQTAGTVLTENLNIFSSKFLWLLTISYHLVGPDDIGHKGQQDLAKSYSTWRVNSLGPIDTIWRQRSGSTLAQVMACCLMAPRHYLNQCRLIISKIQWHFHKVPQPLITEISLKITYLKFHSNLPGANGLTETVSSVFWPTLYVLTLPVDNFGEVDDMDTPHVVVLAKTPDPHAHGAVTRLRQQPCEQDALVGELVTMPTATLVCGELDGVNGGGVCWNSH